MSRKEELLKMLPYVYRNDPWINEIYNAVGLEIEKIDPEIRQVGLNNFFNTMSIEVLRLEEKRLGLTPRKEATYEERAAAVEAAWKSSGKISVELLQKVCDSWKNGTTEIEFAKDGTYKVTFTGLYGVPSDLTALENAINKVKQPYIPISYIFKYLLIKDIHQVKTINQMNQLKLKQFAGGEKLG